MARKQRFKLREGAGQTEGYRPLWLVTLAAWYTENNAKNAPDIHAKTRQSYDDVKELEKIKHLIWNDCPSWPENLVLREAVEALDKAEVYVVILCAWLHRPR